MTRNQQPSGSGAQPHQRPLQGAGPPQQAIGACKGQRTGSSCSFDTPHGHDISGTCKVTPKRTVACVPERRRNK